MEKNVGAAMDKYDLGLTDIFLGLDELKEKVIAGLSENNIEKAFEDSVNEIDLTFDKLKENLFAIDKTLVDSSTRYRERIISSINELKSKATKSAGKQTRNYNSPINKIIKFALSFGESAGKRN